MLRLFVLGVVVGSAAVCVDRSFVNERFFDVHVCMCVVGGGGGGGEEGGNNVFFLFLFLALFLSFFAPPPFSVSSFVPFSQCDFLCCTIMTNP